jgi:hypothetical protein
MKVRVDICREIEVDINSSALEELDANLRGTPLADWGKIDNNLVMQGIKDVEKALGIPFGDEYAPETISRVCAMDGEPILEW